MTAKDYLRQARRLKVAINGKTERMMQLRAIAESATIHISDMPRGGSGKDRMAIVDLIVDFANEIAEETAPLVRMHQGIQRTINQIQQQDYRTVLELYYLNGYRWDEVAERMHYSERSIYAKHGEALVEFERFGGIEYGMD